MTCRNLSGLFREPSSGAMWGWVCKIAPGSTGDRVRSVACYRVRWLLWPVFPTGHLESIHHLCLAISGFRVPGPRRLTARRTAYPSFNKIPVVLHCYTTITLLQCYIVTKVQPNAMESALSRRGRFVDFDVFAVLFR